MHFLARRKGFRQPQTSGFAFVAKDSVRDRDEEILMKSVFVPRPGVVAGPKTSIRPLSDTRTEIGSTSAEVQLGGLPVH